MSGLFYTVILVIDSHCCASYTVVGLAWPGSSSDMRTLWS